MSRKLKAFIGIILSIIVLIFFEEYVYKFFYLIGVNISGLSYILQLIISFAIKLIMCFIIYLLFKKDFRKRKSTFNLIKDTFLFIILLIVITLVMYVFNRYIVTYIGDIFNVKVLGIDFYNIFNKTISLELILKIIINYIFNPFLYCTVIILNADKLCSRNDTFMLVSGLIALIVNCLIIRGTVGFAIINSLGMLLMFSILAYLKRKINNIWFVIILYSLYLVSSMFIINYFGWSI